jgi:acyl-[acyl-carrier-protein]-phospholipid O-acyltransferase/long-chain-fatty-acid--[acyl-carrier-protein] ligase
MATPVPPFALLAQRRFGPLFATNLLGTFNDNLFKTGLLMLASYGLYRADPAKAALLASVATGLFIAPFFLFSALAGQVADAFDRTRLVRMVKMAEVAIMALGLAGFASQSVGLLLAALFLMGAHSAVYQPLKYAILPQQLGEGEILGAAGVMEAGGFLAILGGQLLGGLVAPWQAGVVATALAGAGLVASLAIPSGAPCTPGARIDFNAFRMNLQLVRLARGVRPVWLSILAMAWFYAVGAVLLGQLIPLVQGVLHAGPHAAVLFLTIFSVGVAAGSLLVNRLLRGEVSARCVPVSALLLAGFLVDLSLAIGGFHSGARGLDAAGFAEQPGAWRILLDLAAISVCGGVYVIPLYAIIQTHSPAEQRSRILAANNIVNAGVTVTAIAVATALLKLGVGIPGLIGLMGVLTLAVALAACALLPETVIKALVRAALKLAYRVELTGAENMPQPGQGAVVVVNHVSYIDALLLAAFLPGKPTFAVHTRIASAWWMKPVMPLFDGFPVDATNPLSVKAMVKAVREGRTLVIFPEGRITVTGALMKVFAGPGMVADKAGAPIIPVRVDGAQYTRFSHMKGKVRLRRFPKIRLTVLPAQRFEVDGVESARARRARTADRLYDLMSEMMFATADLDRTLFQALVDARAAHGAKALALEDVKRKPLTYDRLVVGARVLAKAFEPVTRPGEAVGLMLPNVNPALVAFFALQAGGRVAAMLNYTAGPAHLQSACDTALIRTVITSRAFVEQARLEGAVARLEASGRRILWLEDVAAGVGALAKVRALAADRISGRPRQDADRPAVILFTSGSEGAPKAVVLSHRNILANCAQVAARIDFNPTDRVLNALPIFHSFGLTGGALLPLLNGVRVLLYPNPLHYGAIPAFAYDASATILFGSDTFLAGYARAAQSYDFYSLRYIFAGAEPVKAETRARFADRFGLRILEGYGATECAPVIAVNTPMHFKAGSVGRLLPGMEARLEPAPGIAEGGRLHVRGPNVMAGYYLADAPGVLQPPKDGWHDTGDIVAFDEDGFAAIRGRAKRFAKIGGEMVSLAAVEACAAGLWPDAVHAVVARPDPRKGEELVLFTTEVGATAGALQAWGRSQGVAELALPRDLRLLEGIPVLATGKIDYVALNAQALNTPARDRASAMPEKAA